MATLKIKRVYEPEDKSDGFRVLVDRLWPRGIKKEAAHVHLWMKEIAPSTHLRKWFNHDVKKWEAFEEKYEAELEQSPVLGELIEEIKKHKKVTLLYGAKDEKHNQATILKNRLQKK